MKELYLIRHGKTYGNTLGRYIGTTDEPLCEEGREALQAIFEAGIYPMPDVQRTDRERGLPGQD